MNTHFRLWRTCYLRKWSSRFDAVRLFAVGLHQVYANKPATIDELPTNIEHEIAAVSTDLCLKIVKNGAQRLDFCKRVRGCHAKDRV